MKVHVSVILPFLISQHIFLPAEGLLVPSQARCLIPRQQTWNGLQNMYLGLYATEHMNEKQSESTIDSAISRRNLLRGTFGLVAITSSIGSPFNVNVANAIPMVSTDEFSIIIRDSARSIDVVEFSGIKSETVKVILVDGTTFGLNDVIESSTDPRSPLKVAAMCKANKIPYKFVNIEAVLNASPRKKKVYANARVLEAAEKEKEKAIRMEQDEISRQQQLRGMQ